MQKETQRRSSLLSSLLGEENDWFGKSSPLRLFIIIITSIFLAEIIAMAVVYPFSELAYYQTTLIDAAVMVFLVFPILYWFSFHPLIQKIEKLQQTEKALQLLSSVVEQTADTVVVTNCDGVIEYVNPAFEELTDYQKEEAIGQTPRILKSGTHDNHFYQRLWDTVLNGQVFHGEITNRKKNGEIFHEVKTITPLRNADGKITRFVATGKDITERKLAEEQLRKAYDDLELRVQERTEELRIANSELEEEIHVRRRAEQALQQSERRLERAQEIAHLGSWELDLSTNQLIWSDEVYRIFGLRPQEFGATYEAFLEAVHPDDRAVVDATYSGSIRDGRDSYEIEHRVVKRTTGEIRIVHEKCEHFRNEANQIIRSVGMVHDITERRKAEENLQRYQLLSEHSRDIIIFMRFQDGQILNVNAAASQAYGYSREELLSVRIQDLRADNANKLTADQMAQANERGILFETIHRRKDGSSFPVEVSSQGATIGGVRTLISIVRDITERKRAEAALQLSEENFSKAFRSSPAALMITRLADGTYLELNDAYSTIVGFDRSELQGHRATEFNIFLDTSDRKTIVAKLLEKGSVRNFEIDIRNRSGSIRHVVAAQELITFDGESAILSSLVDVTERKQAEQALQKSEAMLRAMLENMPSGVTVRDAVTGELVLANTRGREIMGNLVERAEQFSEYRAVHSDGSIYRSDEWPMSRSIATGEQINAEEIGFERIPGVWNTLSISSAPIRDPHGKIVSAVSIFHDVTERKKAEKELQQLNRTLKALSASNQVMMRAKSEGELLNEVCKIVVKDCGHAMVWIGYAEDDAEKSVRPVASAGFEAGYLETLKITWADTERGRGPTGTAIRTGIPQACRDMLTDPQFAPWREQALQRGYASSIVFPLAINGQVFGAITIYAREPEAFSLNEERLLTELARDLAHGIETIRLRDVRDRVEAQLRLARDELEIRVEKRTAELAAANLELSSEIAERKEIERQLRIQTAAMEAAANGIVITDPKGSILWANPAISQMSGYGLEDLAGQSTRLFSSGKHGADFYRQMWGTILAGEVWHGEITNRRRNGSLYIEEQTITPVYNEDGQLSHFIAVKQDVTERKLIQAQLEESNRELTTLSISERQQRFLAEGLVESSTVLNMSLELYEVLDRIFEQTRRTIPYLQADIVLIEGDIATIVRQWGAHDSSDERKTIIENDNIKIHEFPIWERICATKSAVMIPNTESENQWKSYFGIPWIRSYLGTPLIYNDQIIGIINLVSDRKNAFREEMAQTLRAFAAPAAVAIQNARLYENEQHNRRMAETLSQASVALVQTLDIQTVMETILDYAQRIMPFDVAFIILSEGEERYRIRTVRTGGENNEFQNSLQDQVIDLLNEPIVGPYFMKNESTLIPDSREIPQWNPPVELTEMNCWLGIPLESIGKTLGIVVIAHKTPYSFKKNQIQLAEVVVKQAVVALQNAWLFEQVRSGRERLQQLSRHLVEVQENERKYIARELHDETSQSLTSLKMGLQVIEQKAADHEDLMEQVEKLKFLADETLESLHHLAVNLRPASLDHLSLEDALTGLIETTRQRSGLAAHFKSIGSMQLSLVTEEIETSIYRIVQESITNVVRHAHASYVDVIVEWQADKIVIIIEDDGIGMDMQKSGQSGRLGLVGMQERAEMLGGSLLVDSTPQVGTTLVVEIPYVNSNTDRR